MFYKYLNPNEIEGAADFIAGLILDKLKLGLKVLWLVSGGSAIKVASLATKKISLEPHHNLTVTLVDERYGVLDHVDSNWLQLKEAGFNLPQAKLIPVLEGYEFLETAKIFSSNLEQALASSDYTVGLFGIGPDGHTAGILPNGPAISAQESVCAYEAGNFKRITITPKIIARLNEGVVFAVGESKWSVLERLKQEINIAEQPAQILKKINKLTIFTDDKLYENSN